MNKLACRVCNTTAKNPKVIAKDYFLGTKKEYEYERCINCGSLFLLEIPSDLQELYKNYYSFSSYNPVSFFRRWMYMNIVKSRLVLGKLCALFLNKQDDLPIKSLGPINLTPQTRILDVGCGSGSLLSLLHEMGFKNGLGIDPFLECDKILPNGLELKKAEFFDIEEKFDVIMFHHVFEHFPNIKEPLNHVHNLLTDNGVCIIRMPDVDSFSYMRYKENWFSIHAPFHTALPSRKGMEQMTHDSGLVIEKLVGEQLIDFFFYSMAHELGVADYEQHGNRKYFEKYGNKKIPPLHIKNERRNAKQRLKQVKRHNLCDWSIYYLRKNTTDEISLKQHKIRPRT